MSNQKRSYYAIIPASVRYCVGLSPSAKLLYGEITALSNEKGYCWANNHYFSELYEVEKKTISRWINMLVEFGFLKSELDATDGNSRKLYLSESYLSPKMSIGYRQNCPEGIDKIVHTSRQNCPEGIDKNVLHNNTFNNKDNNTVNEGFALDFLKQNFPSRYQDFEMKNKKQIKIWDKFCLDFNDTVEMESLEFTGRILFGRLGKYARNWIQNQERFAPKEDENFTPTYLRKIL